MPKEYIVPEMTDRRADQLGGVRESVMVGWSSNGYVQIATVLKPGVEGANQRLAPDIDPNELTDIGQHVDLSRSDLNRLIRVLRTARDKAYGADA